MDIRNIYSGKWRESSHGEKFQREHMSLTDMDAGHLIGCSAFRVQPGKRAFPKHAHLVNDESIFVIAGSGELTVGTESQAVEPGDYVPLPCGSEFAHVLVNTGSEDLVYLCMSTNKLPEVVHYPDSEKLGVLENRDFWRGGNAGVSGFYMTQEADYWDGED